MAQPLGVKGILELDEVVNNQNAKIIVAGFQGSTGIGQIEGYIVSNTVLATEITYGSPEKNSQVSWLNNIIQKATPFVNKVTGLTIPNGQLRSLISTVSTWDGTNNYSFNLDMLFIAKKPEDNVLENITVISEAAQPLIVAGVGEYSVKDFGQILIAPNSYTLDGYEIKSGGFSIRIGTWFNTPPWFLLKSYNFDVSKEVIKNGNPLYVKATLGFECYRVLGSTEIISFFPKLISNY